MSTLYAGGKADVDDVPDDASAEERMQALIDTLSAYIEHFHGGGLELVSFDGQKLLVRMSGACEGCNLQQVTLHGWIEGTVRPFFPELQEVVAVE
jgi:Fe-S cluster biogenesis protein NfuA